MKRTIKELLKKMQRAKLRGATPRPRTVFTSVHPLSNSTRLAIYRYISSNEGERKA